MENVQDQFPPKTVSGSSDFIPFHTIFSVMIILLDADSYVERTFLKQIMIMKGNLIDLGYCV